MSANSYRLRMGHNTPFRRTIVPDSEDGEQYQLIIEPNQDYELSDEELAGLKQEIETGLLVPTDKDEHGRQRPNRTRPERGTPAKSVNVGNENVKTSTVGGTPGGRKSKGVNVGNAHAEGHSGKK